MRIPLTSHPRSSRAQKLLTLLSLFALLAQPAYCQLSGDETALLKRIEEKIFFKSYDDEKPEERVARLEKRVFGDPDEGPLANRVAKLAAVTRPDDKKPEPVKPKAVLEQVQKPSAQTEQMSAEDARDLARRRALEARDEEVNQLQTEAIELWKNRRGQEALAKFQQVVRLAPDYADAHFSIGVVYEAQRDYVNALTSYKRALELAPQKREYKDAVALTEKKAREQQMDAGKLQELRELSDQASGAYKRGEYQSALQLYKELDQKAPKEALVKYNIGTIYLALKNPVDALDYFKQALKLKPDEPNYKLAVQKLGSNLAQEESQREQAEQAWNTDTDKKKSRKDKSKKDNSSDFGGADLSSRGQAPPSAALGIATRGTAGGVEITTVGGGSRAAKAGVKRGDIIRAIDGMVVNSPNDLNAIISRKQPGEGVQLIIQREGKIGQFVL